MDGKQTKVLYEELRKELLGALIGLAKTCSNNPKTEDTDRILIEGLVAVNEPNFGEEILKKKLERVRQEKHIIAPNCSTCASPCGNTSDYDVDLFSQEEESYRVLKRQIFTELMDVAVVFYQAMVLGKDVSEHTGIFYKILEVVTYTWNLDRLEQLLVEILQSKLSVIGTQA